jgi:hypothetical protein
MLCEGGSLEIFQQSLGNRINNHLPFSLCQPFDNAVEVMVQDELSGGGMVLMDTLQDRE